VTANYNTLYNARRGAETNNVRGPITFQYNNIYNCDQSISLDSAYNEYGAQFDCQYNNVLQYHELVNNTYHEASAIHRWDYLVGGHPTNIGTIDNNTYSCREQKFVWTDYQHEMYPWTFGEWVANAPDSMGDNSTHTSQYDDGEEYSELLTNWTSSSANKDCPNAAYNWKEMDGTNIDPGDWPLSVPAWSSMIVLRDTPGDPDPVGEIGSWEFDGDLTDESGNNNTLTDHGTITFSEGAAIFNGTDQWASITNLSDDISDITIYVKFEMTADLAPGVEHDLCGEYDYGDDERNFLVAVADDGVDDGNGDNLYLAIGHSAGFDREFLEHTYDIPHGTPVVAVLAYDTSADDAWAWLFSTPAGVELGVEQEHLDFLDQDGEKDQNVSATPFTVGLVLNSDNPSGDYFAGKIYAIKVDATTIVSKAVSKALAIKWAKGTETSDPITPQTITATAETVTSIGRHSFQVNYDREVSLITETGIPYIPVSLDYPTSDVRYYASGTDENAVIFSAFLGNGYRLTEFTESKFGAVALEGGKIEDKQTQESGNNKITGLSYPDSDTSIEITADFEFGITETFTSLANIITDLIYCLPGDEFTATSDTSGNINTTGDGTNSDRIIIDGDSYAISGNITIDEDYWTLENIIH